MYIAILVCVMLFTPVKVMSPEDISNFMHKRCSIRTLRLFITFLLHLSKFSTRNASEVYFIFQAHFSSEIKCCLSSAWYLTVCIIFVSSLVFLYFALIKLYRKFLYQKMDIKAHEVRGLYPIPHQEALVRRKNYSFIVLLKVVPTVSYTVRLNRVQASHISVSQWGINEYRN